MPSAKNPAVPEFYSRATTRTRLRFRNTRLQESSKALPALARGPHLTHMSLTDDTIHLPQIDPCSIKPSHCRCPSQLQEGHLVSELYTIPSPAIAIAILLSSCEGVRDRARPDSVEKRSRRGLIRRIAMAAGCGGFVEKAKPYIAMISLQFGYAGMNVLTKVSLNNGMSHYVLVVYRHAFATLSIAPFALVLERKVRPKMTWPIFWQIFVLAMLGPVIDQNFYYAGLKFTGPTFACAMSNILPAMTFVLAVIFRMEKLQMKKVRCQAKVLGTVVTVAGAMLMTLYKGPLMQLPWTTTRHVHASSSAAEAPAAGAEISGRDWFLGSVFVIVATLAWASLFVLQTHTIKQYSAQLSLTTLVCFIGTLQAIVVTFVMERRTSVWTIGFDMNLLAAAYAGIVTSSIAYYVQGLVIQKTGPVFASAFSPLMMIIVAVMGSFILSEKIYLGGVLGAVLIVAGLYSVLWGKHKETQEKEADAKTALPMMAVLPAASSMQDAAAGCNIGNNGVRSSSSSGVRGAAAAGGAV